MFGVLPNELWWVRFFNLAFVKAQPRAHSRNRQASCACFCHVIVRPKRPGKNPVYANMLLCVQLSICLILYFGN